MTLYNSELQRTFDRVSVHEPGWRTARGFRERRGPVNERRMSA